MRLSDFAKALGMSVHTAKRRLIACGEYRRLAKVEQSSGKHWRVVLSHPNAIRYLRIWESFSRIFKRRPGLRGGFPRLGGGDWREGWAKSKMVFNDDLAGFIADLQAEMPDRDLDKVNDEQMCDLVSYFWLIRACQDIQKRGKSPTAAVIADSLGVSVAALYRKPFSTKMLRDAISRATGGQASAVASLNNQTICQDNLSLRISRSSKPRGEYFKQRRREAKYCYLAWNLWRDDSDDLRTAHLRCFFERPREGPKVLRSQQRWCRKRHVLTPTEIAGSLAWMRLRGQIGDGENVASIWKSLDASGRVQWQVGDFRGSCLTLGSALYAVERYVNPQVQPPRYEVLNLKVEKRYLIPWVASPVFDGSMTRGRRHPAGPYAGADRLQTGGG